MSERLDVVHRRHRIIAGASKTGPAAVVYQGRTKLHQAHGPTVTAALADAKAWIEAVLDGERRGRSRPHVATRQEYSDSCGRRRLAALRRPCCAPTPTRRTIP